MDKTSYALRTWNSLTTFVAEASSDSKFNPTVSTEGHSSDKDNSPDNRQ